MSSLLVKIRHWFSPSESLSSTQDLDDETKHLIEAGRLRARIHDLGGAVDQAMTPLRQLEAFEERLDQLRCLRTDRLQQGELLETQLHGLERDLQALVIKRFRRIIAYLELDGGKADQRSTDALSALISDNEQSLEQLEDAIHHLIAMDQGDRDEAMAREFDLLNDVLRSLAKEPA
jgi:hypothetical protein